MIDLTQSDLSLLKNKTKLNPDLIMKYFKQFLIKYPKGRIKKDEFINDIVINLIIEEKARSTIEKKELHKEKIQLCERLFDICDQDESGKVDFVEVSLLNDSLLKSRNTVCVCVKKLFS